MKLTFWIATQDADGSCYNIVARTKRDCLLRMAENAHVTWGGPHKSTVQYADAFELFDWVTGEAGGRRQYSE